MNKIRTSIYLSLAALMSFGIYYYQKQANLESKTDFERGIKKREKVHVLDDPSDTVKLGKSLSELAVIEFSITSCSPCKTYELDLEEALKKYKKIKVFYYNLDNCTEIADYLVRKGVIKEVPSSYPHTIFWKDGKVIGEQIGRLPQNNLTKIDSMLQILQQSK